jgi:DNA polymerase I-like protein with 3'-5' exonuclease and polymerase domains
MVSRDDIFAALIRSIFIPEDGQKWYSCDYNQQEYRLIVYVSELLRKKGASEAADMYRRDKSTDFHRYVVLLTKLPRPRAKDCNFAKSYGAGVPRFALMIGSDELEAKKIMDLYDEKLPFVRLSADHCNKFAANNGYINLIDGARNHFNLWEPIYRDYAMEKRMKEADAEISTNPCHEDEAARRYNDPKHPWYREKIKRAFTHKAFNRAIQGSAARQMKKAMVDVDAAGYDPILQVHDELCFSLDEDAQAFDIAKIMENAMPRITIPMLVDVEKGMNWGQQEKIFL